MDLFQQLEKQIDALFDELKNKVKNTNQPPSTLASKPRKVSKPNTYFYIPPDESFIHFRPTISEYSAVSKILEELQTVIYSEDVLNLDAVIDQFRNRIKEVVKDFATRVSQQTQPVSTQPIAQQSPKAKPEPVKPEPVAKPEPIAQQLPKAKPEPVKPEPVAPEKPDSSEEDDLVRVGKIIKFAKKLAGGGEPSLEDIEWAKEQAKDYNPQEEAPNKRQELVALAKEYQNRSLNKPTSTEPIIPSKEPSEAELLAMNPEDFKSYLLKYDPELAGAYEGEKWWSRRFRKDIVNSHIQMRGLKPKAESFSSIFRKYKSN